jgi:hypothetical protein
MTGCRVHYVILRRRPLEDSTVVGGMRRWVGSEWHSV